jgi:uncharacterized protein (UPF0332 family)
MQLGDVDRMYLRNYLRDGQRHLEAAVLLFENGFYDYCVKEAYESMLWHVDALLLTVGIKTLSATTAISGFGREFVRKDIYPMEFYEHLLLSNASYRIADSEFGATILKDEAGCVLGFSREFRDIVAYLKDLGVEQPRNGEDDGAKGSGPAEIHD